MGAILNPERQLQALRAMIDAGAQINCRDREGITPLGHARRVLAGVRLGEEVAQAFRPNAASLPTRDRREQQSAEAVVDLIASAGGRE